MKKSVVGGLITALLVAGASLASAATNVYSVNVVGFQQLDLVGGTNYNLISVPMTKIPVYRGTITGNTSNTISDSSASWTAGEFAVGVSGKETYGKSTFFVEITSSNAPLAGRHFYVATNSANTLTVLDNLGVADNALNTYSYKIVPANRIRDVFGETNAPILLGGSTFLTADNILFWIPGSGWSAPVFFRQGALTQTTRNNHWVQGSVVVDDTVVDRDEGILVKRVASSGTNITVAGEVSGNIQAVALDVIGTNTYSIIGGMSAVDVSIGQSGLTNALTGGATFLTADNLLYWTPGSGWSAPVFFRQGALTQTTRNNHWVQGSTVVDDSLILKAGQGYLILKRTSSDVWERNSPL